jgi:hypothetical protein
MTSPALFLSSHVSPSLGKAEFRAADAALDDAIGARKYDFMLMTNY